MKERACSYRYRCNTVHHLQQRTWYTMLPDRLDPSFPDALKQAREERQMSLTDLAQAAGISSTMPGRYENRNSALFTVPSLDTWKNLNLALFPEEALGFTVKDKDSQLSIEQLIEQLKAKGAKKINLEF